MSNTHGNQAVLCKDFDFESAIGQVREQGYYFANDALTGLARAALSGEIARLPLTYADHVAKPIAAGTRKQVRQQHERFYTAYPGPETPVANRIVEALAQAVRLTRYARELDDWLPREIGYQRYSAYSGFIDPHRDRASDRKLSVTFTIEGSAAVKIFNTIDDPSDYSAANLEQSDMFTTQPGSIMLLRASGLNGGEQTIHQVLPPTDSVRTIINLRDRTTVLEQPDHPRWQGNEITQA